MGAARSPDGRYLAADTWRLGEICSCLGGDSKPIGFITIVITFSGRVDKAQVPRLIYRRSRQIMSQECVRKGPAFLDA